MKKGETGVRRLDIQIFGEVWAYLRVYYICYETYRFGDRCVSCVLSLK